jgi:hypothetical protein
MNPPGYVWQDDLDLSFVIQGDSFDEMSTLSCYGSQDENSSVVYESSDSDEGYQPQETSVSQVAMAKLRLFFDQRPSSFAFIPK